MKIVLLFLNNNSFLQVNGTSLYTFLGLKIYKETKVLKHRLCRLEIFLLPTLDNNFSLHTVDTIFLSFLVTYSK